jgi:hypothetical protein
MDVNRDVHPDDERSRAPMVVWRGQLVLQGGPAPFGVEASAAGATAADSDVWTALPIAGSSIETSGRVEVSALKNHLVSLCGKRAKWSLGLACFRCSDAAWWGGPPPPPPLLHACAAWEASWQLAGWLAD